MVNEGKLIFTQLLGSCSYVCQDITICRGRAPAPTMYYISYNNPTISYKMVRLLLFIQDFLIIFAPENISILKIENMDRVSWFKSQ